MGTVRYQVIEKDGQEIVKEIHKIVVHQFYMGDVEDPDIYAAEPIWNWEKSEQGQFVMENAINTPEWNRHIDYTTFGHRYAITAELESKKLAEFYLRWGNDGSKSSR